MRWWPILAVLATSSCLAQESDISKRAIDGSDADAATDEKFRVYVGTIDGVRRELFNEVNVDGAPLEFHEVEVPPARDPFGAYDDTSVITTENEKNLFVPKPYRPPKKEDKKKTTTQSTTTPRPTTRPTIRTSAPTAATLAPRPQPIAPFPPQAPQARPFETVVVVPPSTPAPFVQQPVQQQNFQPVQQQFNQPQVIQQPQPIQPIAPQQPGSRTRRPPVAPPQQAFEQQPTTPAPQLPFAGTQNLRTGVCQSSIFYISTPISGPTRLTFTHFAIAVTVDQCARTCHEFNCAIAHYNPINGHCEFNPSTAFAIRNGQCPAWPSLHYRNNVVASEPVRIFCVTCQRPRRRSKNRGGLRERSARNGKGIFRSSRKAKETLASSQHPVIHGVLVKQPQAVALGLSQSTLEEEAPAVVVHGVSQVELPSAIPLEEANSRESRTRVQGTTISESRMIALSELDLLNNE